MKTSFIRKIVYLVILGVLLVVLHVIGRPAKVVVNAGVSQLDPGGVLAQIRDKEGLTESRIGEIDPASNTIKLATFGLRGVAIAMLWHRSQEYQKRLDWNNVIATSNQLVLLEPHFTTIWEFLGWNLSYNASAEFDDYRERYRWVIRGIDFLTRGVEFNRQAPKLCKATGWTISQKIGIADENQQYRRLLREDEDFGKRHNCTLPSDRDNWMLGRRWYHMGEDLVLRGVSIGNESDFLFFSHSRLNLFNYAMWKRKDAIFGDEAIKAWDYAGEEWNRFSKMDLSTAIPEDGSLRMKPGVKAKRATLETTDLIEERRKQLLGELGGIIPGFNESLCLARWKELGETPGQQGSLSDMLDKAFDRKSKHETDHEEIKIVRKWLDENRPNWREELAKDLDSLYTPEQLELRKIPSLLLEEEQRDVVSKADGAVSQVRARALEILLVGPKVLAQELQEKEISREQKGRAREIAEEIDGFKEATRMSDLYRGILNYEFRIREVAVERTHEVDEARKKRHFARVAYYDGRIADSISGWLDAMGEWQKLLDKPGFEDISTEAQFIRDIIDIVEKFVIILDNDNKIFPDKFPLQGLIRNKLNQENNPDEAIRAFEYSKKLFDGAAEKSDFEKLETFFRKVSERFDGLNHSVEFMKLAPLSDIRDMMIVSNACYVKTLQKLGKPLPEPLPLRSYVELMMKHDPAIDKAVDAMQPGVTLLQDKKAAEAQAEFDKAIELWKPILDKYPIIPLDSTLETHADLSLLANLYAESLKSQTKEIPADFPLKNFLK